LAPVSILLPAVARILLVDDSASARALLGVRLRDAGHDVVEVADAAAAAELALANPPDAVVTDLWMPGISGLQLCRLLRAEPATQSMPVVLLTASDDRRSRFWARHAGATTYVTKTEIDRLTDLLGDLTSSPKTRPPPSLNLQTVTRGNVQERLSQLLDATLFESTIAGEVRALSQYAEDLEYVFEALSALASDVTGYRWLALTTDSAALPQMRYGTHLFIHTHPSQKAIAEREARDSLEVAPPPERRKPDEGDAFFVLDRRAVEAEWSTPPILLPVPFGTSTLGRIALAPSRRGASVDDRRLIAMMANELGGPLQMAALVAEARRLASTDTLTGLLNRRAFIERIEKARAASDKQLFPISVLLLDIDHFKKVNDTLGHDAGDIVLQGVARVLSGIARKSDFLARWGGEEFVLVLTATAEAGARVAAERVRRAIAEAKYVLPDGTEHHATASIGLTSAENVEWDLHNLLVRADKAMYSAKHRGRNRVETA
jgi:two-component system cell cycle response regulator